jgi:hypothetical protein
MGCRMNRMIRFTISRPAARAFMRLLRSIAIVAFCLSAFHFFGGDFRLRVAPFALGKASLAPFALGAKRAWLPLLWGSA